MPSAVDRYLAVGGFPEHVLSDDHYQVRERLRADIADRAIRRDLIRLDVAVERVRDLFVYLIQDSGAIINARKRGRDIDADERSVGQWIHLLEDAHLIVRLPRYTRNAAARLRSKPRIYAADHGLITAFTPSGSPSSDPWVRGRVVEAAVFRHLREVAASTRGELSFFRDDNDDGLEGDFVLEYAANRVVVEATADAAPPSKKFNRLRQVGKILGASHVVLVQGGLAPTKKDGVVSLSIPEFLFDPMLVTGQKR